MPDLTRGLIEEMFRHWPSRSRSAETAPDPFADDVLERLVRSNGDYQRAHGHYIVPLAERLLAARAEIAWLRERNIRLMELASRG